MLCVIAGGVVWYANRPKPERPWNQSAIKGFFFGVSFSFQSDRMICDFRYSLLNTTDRDYRLPADAKIMVRLQEDMSYRDSPGLSLEKNLYIPASQKVNISITLPIMFSDFSFSKDKAGDEKVATAFIDRRLAEIDGFALFDPTNRYKVDFPNGWPEAVKRVKEKEAAKNAKPEDK